VRGYRPPLDDSCDPTPAESSGIAIAKLARAGTDEALQATRAQHQPFQGFQANEVEERRLPASAGRFAGRAYWGSAVQCVPGVDGAPRGNRR